MSRTWDYEGPGKYVLQCSLIRTFLVIVEIFSAIENISEHRESPDQTVFIAQVDQGPVVQN